MEEHLYRRAETLPLPPDTGEDIRVAADFFLPGVHPENLLFYDTETTGLSGGAGTIAFLLGFAALEGDRIAATQFFLTDFPGEPDLLAAAAGEQAGKSHMLSYNGRSFDAPLLRTRLVMNRLPPELPAQFDLLFPARRLWRRILPDCRLETLESRILGRGRTGDVPGSEIPGLYFDFLARGNPEPMGAVVRHNREDVLSLVHLFVHLGKIIRDPLRAGRVDAASLGSMLLPRHARKGLSLLLRAAGEGDPRALRSLSAFYKRNRMWGEAERLWRAAPEGDEYSRVELAKLCEHRLGALDEALAITDGLLDRPGPADGKAGLLRRKDRLERKLRRLRG